MANKGKFSIVPHALDDSKKLGYKDESKQHVLKHGDKLIYAVTRSFMNKDSRKCWPTKTTIASIIGCKPSRVTEGHKRLVKAGYMTMKKGPIPNSDKYNWIYEFPKTDFDEQFEMFGENFLKLDLEMMLKEYYMDLQRYLYYNDDVTVGTCTFSDYKLSQLTGWSLPTITKFNKQLQDLGLLELTPTKKKDEAGLTIFKKEIKLKDLKQHEVLINILGKAVLQHDDRLTTVEEKVDRILKLIDIDDQTKYEF